MRRPRIGLFFLVLAMLGLIPGAAAAATSYVLKFATLAPEGTSWMNVIDAWATQVAKASGGRLKFKLYPGGVMGDEPDMVREIRLGELQGAAFTGHGIGEIYSPARVLEIPFLFHNYAEVDSVRDQLLPQIRQGFRRHGFVLLGFMDTGFMYVFSRVPVGSLQALKARRVWMWEGDPLERAFFKVSGVPPVPLGLPDVYTSLSTGLIDTEMAPPFGAIAFQWFTKTPFMVDMPLADGIGGLIVTRSFFDRLPADLQALLRNTGEAAGKAILKATRVDNARSLAVLKAHGVTFLPPWTDTSPAALAAMRDKAARLLATSGYIPAATYAQARADLVTYRADPKRVK